MRRYLSSKLEAIKENYDVVVIGSGYGGSIAASRLSRAGKNVCVLERGRELQPGDYPDNLYEAKSEMQINTESRQFGHKTGLYDFHVHKDISVLVGCGLGGTSLINANVSILPEKWVFESKSWPARISKEFNEPASMLHAGYLRAAEMLKPNPLPDSIRLNKLNALKCSVSEIGGDFSRANINVNFDVEGVNHVGVDQQPCNLCGNCCSGCNYGAKNTVLMNYLPDAVAFGTSIFTEAGVEYVEKLDTPNGAVKWKIHFRNLNPDAPVGNMNTVIADVLIVAAGTLGSTEIMLRSKANGLILSEQLGKSFSGNGDMLAFGYNTEVKVDAVGAPARDVLPNPTPGPCITGIIDMRQQAAEESGIVIQDAVIPGVLAGILPVSMFVASKVIGVPELSNLDDTWFGKLKRTIREGKSLRKGAYQGAVENMQTYLVMSHDGSAGKLMLNSQNRLTILWKGIGDHSIFKKATKILKAATKALSGIYIKNPYFKRADREFLSAENILLDNKNGDPLWLEKLQNTPLTVHPLGGCSMGDDSLTGVVNERGQVYTTETGVSVYDGLYIADGSIISRSLGVNPLLTISALAERICALIAQDRGWQIDYSFGPPRPFGSLATVKAEPIGIEFTEVMSGDFTTDAGTKNALSFTLTIHSDDVYEMISNPGHEASITGFVVSPALGTGALSVFNGIFNLFIDDVNNVNVKFMKYRMNVRSGDLTYYLVGEKRIFHDRLVDELTQATTLFTTIYLGLNQTGTLFGQGIVRISRPELAKMLSTIRAVNAPTEKEALRAIASFGKYFSNSLFEVYGGIFSPLDFFDSYAPERKKRPLRTKIPEPYEFYADDPFNTKLMLTRYQGGIKGPLLMTHGFSGNRYTFSIDTIDTNAVEYFYEHGYDVWLLDLRTSTLLESSFRQHSVDDIANFDYPGAIKKIQQVTNAKQIDILAHCLGSMSLFMALMNGMKGVRSVVCAQNAAHFYPAKEVRWKAGFHLPELLDLLGIKSLTAYAEKHENWQKRLYDRLLNIYAEAVAGYCNSPSCHRLTFMFGPLSEHRNLNSATHTALIEMFGRANITTFEHLTKMVRKRYLVNESGRDVYLPHISRLNIPITFIHGEKNALFMPKSTAQTYKLLCEVNGPANYRYHLIPGYGHNDCMYGKKAANDVFPHALAQFDACNP